MKGLGLDIFTDPAYYSSTVSVARVDAKWDLELRRRLVADFNIMIAGGLGPLKGKVIRVGHMGQSARHENIELTLAATRPGPASRCADPQRSSGGGPPRPETMAASFILRCMSHGCEFDSASRNLVCANCGGSLEASYDYETLRTSGRGIPAEEKRSGVWRYSPLLPLNPTTPIITLGEGSTPLVRASRLSEALNMERVYIKDESRNPTLSFKDRKSTVAVSKAAEFGARGIVNMTAGNAGSSVAAYAGKAGISAYIFTIEGSLTRSSRRFSPTARRSSRRTPPRRS